ncbi:MAG TPA: CocE/NonD family hydrolase [Candidatus Thermoplasmatota archaeon]|nr:CocE/NonD family hydrolase [Candidatus Thermoplasmatota archaeon]
MSLPRTALPLALLLLVPALASPTEARTWNDERARCVDPFPCGDLWPAGLVGPFDYTLHDLDVASDDGARLRGTLVLPTLPDGVRAPAILIATPYWGNAHARPGEAGVAAWPEPWELLARNGFAVAAVNVRGSGLSDGCVGMWGERERLDQRVLVDWLATQPWSNGRVGATGISYGGTTAYEAAIAAGPALKAIVAASPVADPFTLHYSPQGLSNPGLNSYRAAYPVAFGQDVCEDVLRNALDAALGPVASRDAAYWEERHLLKRLPNATAAIFVTHAFRDGHHFQPTDVWDAVRSPKRMMLGHWDHTYPTTSTWDATLVAWFDYWLKGVGSPGKLDRVEYLVAGSGWETSRSWPPRGAESRDIAVEGRFRSAPAAALFDPYSTKARACVQEGPDGIPLGVLAVGPVLARKTKLAGNPYADLWVTSTEDGGAITVRLVDLGPTWACAGGAESDARLLAFGQADLRFHATRYDPTPFPIGEAQRVRVDLTPVGETVPAGHRLAIVLDHGHVGVGLTPYWTPVLDVHAGSRLVVPVV